MKLQKHISRKAKSGGDYFKYEVILPKKEVDEVGFKEGDELEAQATKKGLLLKKK